MDKGCFLELAHEASLWCSLHDMQVVALMGIAYHRKKFMEIKLFLANEATEKRNKKNQNSLLREKAVICWTNSPNIISCAEYFLLTL